MGAILGGVGAPGKEKKMGKTNAGKFLRNLATAAVNDLAGPEGSQMSYQKFHKKGERGLAENMAAQAKQEKTQDAAKNIEAAVGGGVNTTQPSQDQKSSYGTNVRPEDKRNPNGSPYHSNIGGVFGGL